MRHSVVRVHTLMHVCVCVCVYVFLHQSTYVLSWWMLSAPCVSRSCSALQTPAVQFSAATVCVITLLLFFSYCAAWVRS